MRLDLLDLQGPCKKRRLELENANRSASQTHLILNILAWSLGKSLRNDSIRPGPLKTSSQIARFVRDVLSRQRRMPYLKM